MSTLLNDDGQPVRPFLYNILNNQRKSVDELVGFCRGVLADGVVNEAEAIAFREWINKSGERGWPLDHIRGRVERVFADGSVSDEERAELAEIMKQLSGISDNNAFEGATTLPLDDPAPDVKLSSEFCATGRFAFGPRREVFAEIERRGGMAHDAPREGTSYLVIGAFASRDWVHTSYGRKIERAVELRTKGTGIKIIHEEHWMSFLR